MFTFIFSINQRQRILLCLVYLGLIITLSLMPSEEVPDLGLFEGFDKLIHVCMYLGFSWLFCWAFYSGNKYLLNYLIIFLTAGWGVALEIFQMEMHYGRSFEWLDILSNSIGAVLGVVIYNLMRR